MNTDMTRVVKGVAAVIVLLILFFVVMGWWRDYRSARPETTAPETTSTATPTVEPTKTPTQGKKAAPQGKVVTVLIDGLNLRAEPSAAAKRVGGLDKGDKLTLLKQQDGWYQVRTEAKKTGWITDNPQYSRIEE